MNILPDGVNWTLPATIPAFPFLGQQPQENPSSRSLSQEDRAERGRAQSTGRSSSRGRSQQGQGGQSRARSDERRREGQRTQAGQFGTGESPALDMNFLNCLQPNRPEGGPPGLPSRGSSSRELITDDDAAPMLARHVKQMARETMSLLAKSWHFKVGLLLAAAFSCIGCGILLIVSGNDAGNALDLMPTCSETVPCPGDWKNYGSRGGYFCEENGGCRPGASGPWGKCLEQCYVQAPGGPPPPRLMPLPPSPAPAADAALVAPAANAAETAPAEAPAPPGSLTKPGVYDLRVIKKGKLLGCAAPVGKFPGQPKYGCAGDFATAKTCDAAKDPVKDTKYVQAVHDGCETALGRGTYGYAYDDGVGLKQCAPITKYEWVLCPEGTENLIMWQAEQHDQLDATKRFRVTNKCSEPIWIQQAGSAEEVLPGEEAIQMIEPGYSHTYAIPNKGLPSTRFLPKTGCDSSGNNCDIQSMPPCPETGCDLPIDTKFEASWGCQYWTGKEADKQVCALTGQGNPSTYQDWWDGSAVDGWTLPFTVLVDDANHGLGPGTVGTPEICGPVVCANLIAANICPTDEYLTPEVA